MPLAMTAAKRAPRPRGAGARALILKAANDLLEESGMAGFTIEGVAARAGAAKTTIYRWWPSRGALAMDGFLAETAPKIAYPDTGSAVSDLTEQLRLVAKAYGGKPGKVLTAVIAEGQRDPATIDAFIEGYARPRRDSAMEILRQGIERGELRPDIDLETVVDALYGPVYYRMLVPHAPLTEAWVEELAYYVFAGIRAKDAPAR